MISFPCPSCGKQLQAPDDAAGKTGKCNTCGHRITIPKAATIAPPPQARIPIAQPVKPLVAPPPFPRPDRHWRSTVAIAGCCLFGLSIIVALGTWLTISHRGLEITGSARLPNSTNGNPTRPSDAGRADPIEKASLPAPRSLAPELADIVEKIEPAVVRITTDKGVGSGIVVDAKGLIATNYHVIDGASNATVEFENGKRVEVSGYVALDRRCDLAILSIGSASGKFSAITLAAALPRKAERVVALGAPLGLSFSASEGIVSAVRTTKEVRELLDIASSDEDHSLDSSAKWIQTTAAISKGNSGGPLANIRGELVGLNTWYLASGQSLNFAIAATEVARLLTKAEQKPTALASIASKDKGDAADQESQLRAAAPGRFDNADPGDRQRAIEALKRLEAGVNLNTDEARDILEFGRSSEALRNKVAENLARTAQTHAVGRQAVLALLTSSERFQVDEIEKYLKTNALETLPPQYLDFALHVGGDVLGDAIRDANLNNPGPITSEVSRLLHFSRAKRGQFALACADSQRRAGLNYYLFHSGAVEIARVLAGHERRLTDQELAFTKENIYFDDALAEYARPDVQEEIRRKAAKKAAEEFVRTGPERDRAAKESLDRLRAEQIAAIEKAIKTDRKEVARLTETRDRLAKIEPPSDRDKTNLERADAALARATEKLRDHEKELQALTASK